MDVFMPVLAPGTCLGTEGVFEASSIVENLVDKSPVKKCFQGSVDGYPIYLFGDLIFNVTMRQRIILPQEQPQNFLTRGSRPQPEIFQ
jgi:hypothetical protein